MNTPLEFSAQFLIFTVVPVICGVLVFAILSYVSLTAGFRSTLRRRRLQVYALRSQLRATLLEATSAPERLELPPFVHRAARRGWRKQVVLEVARSLSNDTTRQDALAGIALELGLDKSLRRQIVSGSALQRAGAAETIGDLHLTSALPELYVSMRDDDMAVRLASAAAFAQVAPDKAAAGLTRMLLTEPLPVGAQRLAELLAGLGSRASGAVLEALADHPHPLLAKLVVHCSPSEEALPALVAAADTVDPRVRLESVRALGQLASSWALSALLDATSDPDVFVRSAAAVALGQVGDPSAIPSLLALLGDPDHVVRSRAATAVAFLPGGTDALGTLLTSGADPAVTMAVATALQQHLATTGVSALASSDPRMRATTERSVTALLQTTGFRALAESLVLRHPHPMVRSRMRTLLEDSGAPVAPETARGTVQGTRSQPELLASRKEIRQERKRAVARNRALPDPPAPQRSEVSS